jgi:hypothetical protein
MNGIHPTRIRLDVIRKGRWTVGDRSGNVERTVEPGTARNQAISGFELPQILVHQQISWLAEIVQRVSRKEQNAPRPDLLSRRPPKLQMMLVAPPPNPFV